MNLESFDALGAALAKAQAEMSNPRFDKTNPHFRNKFASLAAVRDAVIPVLAKHGIACLQDLTNVEGGVACTTTLLHASGQLLKFGPLKMPVSKADAQGFGSAATYARRYHLMAVANVVGDEDDDANEATGKPAPAVGIGTHSPLGDAKDRVTDIHRKYAEALKQAVAGDGDVLAILADLENECDEKGERLGDEIKLPVWSLLDSKTRSTIKRLIEQHKAAA